MTDGRAGDPLYKPYKEAENAIRDIAIFFIEHDLGFSKV
jgi:hypothetical protein